MNDIFFNIIAGLLVISFIIPAFIIGGVSGWRLVIKVIRGEW